MQNIKSGSGQQKVVSREAIVGGTVVHREEDDEEQSLRLIGNGISVDIFYGFLHYRSFIGNDGIAEGASCHLQVLMLR